MTLKCSAHCCWPHACRKNVIVARTLSQQEANKRNIEKDPCKTHFFLLPLTSLSPHNLTTSITTWVSMLQQDSMGHTLYTNPNILSKAGGGDLACSVSQEHSQGSLTSREHPEAALLLILHSSLLPPYLPAPTLLQPFVLRSSSFWACQLLGSPFAQHC